MDQAINRKLVLATRAPLKTGLKSGGPGGFTWENHHITLMKSGGPGGLQMLFDLGHPSYYSDEIRWSRRFVDAVLLGTPVILL